MTVDHNSKQISQVAGLEMFTGSIILNMWYLPTSMIIHVLYIHVVSHVGDMFVTCFLYKLCLIDCSIDGLASSSSLCLIRLFTKDVAVEISFCWLFTPNEQPLGSHY